ncbi:MAG: mevalonate kinase [Caldilineaceae bacterium]
MSTGATILSKATAPGKVILAGEHAVVYGVPAIAVPVWQVQTTCTVTAAPVAHGCTISLPDVGLTLRLAAETERGANSHPVAHMARRAMLAAGMGEEPDWQIDLASTIPIASGLGSGAALSTALVRAVFGAANLAATAATVSALVYESEKVYHGTPSGIDNTVIAHGRPLWFVREHPPEFLAAGAPLTLLIADTGVRSPTAEAVARVRELFDRVPGLAHQFLEIIRANIQDVRAAFESGDAVALGAAFDESQQWLRAIGVSSPELDRLVTAATAAGALGAKLSGGGRGGNMIALVTAETARVVETALRTAGAVRVISTVVRNEAREQKT